MALAHLDDGTPIHHLVKSEALVLDHHVQGYLKHGITIEDGDVVFDVGANIGIFAVRAVQHGPAVRVFAFEPVPAIYEVLEQNRKLHGNGRLTTLPCGASDQAGTIAIAYYPNSPALSTGDPAFWDAHPGMLSEAVQGNTRNAPSSLWYAKWVPRFLSGFIARHLRRGAETVSCALRTISSVIDEYELDRIDLLKIDCEGAELAALQGIDDRHWPTIHKVVVEVHDVDGRLDTILALLARHGLDQSTVEKEAGFENTVMVNIHAHRSQG